ncbi:MAG TPA: hypothetical protein DCQ06_10635 [Myxococcales bacterium]|nr:hypothetical protein [Myxococcales bacterium]HAN32042.1 hypothetical protein [Myxococcales bacterium]
MKAIDGDSGHFLIAGAVLIGFGAFCLSLASLLTYVVELDLGFISGQSMMFISGLMMCLGWMLRRDGHALLQSER